MISISPTTEAARIHDLPHIGCPHARSGAAENSVPEAVAQLRNQTAAVQVSSRLRRPGSQGTMASLAAVRRKAPVRAILIR
jgi:hypothetical protein